MTSKIKVSQGSDRSFGERDVSARATHLKAATGKVSVTTIERKIMSNKTTFKRIALVVTSALGLGLLTTMPAQAVISSANITVTATDQAITFNSATSSTVSDSTTAGLISLAYTRTSTNDSVIVSSILTGAPTSGGSPVLNLRLKDTTTSTALDTISVVTAGNTSGATAGTAGVSAVAAKTTSDISSYSTGAAFNGVSWRLGAGSGVYATNGRSVANFFAFIDSATTLKTGTYSYLVTVSPYDDSAAGAAANVANLNNINAKSVTINVVVSAPSAATSATYSTATISTGSSFSGVANVDSSVSVAATADTTADAVIRVSLASSTGSTLYASESVTVVATRGSVGTSTAVIGKNVTFAYVAGSPLDIYVYGDGTSGTGTITVSTPTISWPAKSVSFWATSVGSITATQRLNVLSAGTTGNSGAITAVVLDSNGNQNGSSSAVYAYSSNLAVVSDSGTACTYDSTYVRHTCTLTGVANGTATITLKNTAVGSVASTVISSAAITVTVNTLTASKLVFKTNKTSYAPGEKGYIILSAVDSAGKAVAGGSINSLLATGGITTSAQLGASTTSTDLTGSGATTPTLAKTEAAIDGYASLDPIKLITFYAPTQGGDVTLTAVGGSGAGADAGVTKTATFTVTDNAATALAAVTALASQVSAFITKINAQITTLTDLVMKIQKKVKA